MYVALFDTYVGANYENDGEISKYETRVTKSLPCGIPFEVTFKEDNDCWKIKFHRHINHGKISLLHLLHMINLAAPNKDLYLKSPPAVSSYIFGSC